MEGALLDELVREFLDRYEAEGDSALERLCAEHPDSCQALRQRVRTLSDAGLLRCLSGPQRAFPERLGDFRLLERLGQGGMGVVYLAEQVSLGRRVALKLVRPDQLYFPGAHARFRREVEAVARMAHPGIAPVHAVGEEQGVPFFAMELVAGCSLDAVVAALHGRPRARLDGAALLEVVAAAARARGFAGEGRPGEAPFDGSWERACTWIARELAQALEHAHQRGVLHRDIKPSNVMLTPDGRVLLVDFGLASAAGAQALTRSHAELGSLPYMAPESLGSGGTAAARTDVYGLGVTLYELLALEPPFQEKNAIELRAQILAGRAPRLRQRVPSLPRDLEAVVAVAMDAEPRQRYASAADLARDLTRVLDGRPVEARPAGPWVQAVRWCARNPAATAAAVLALAIAVGGPLVFGLQQRAAAREQQRLNAEVEAQRGAAEANLANALEAVDGMLARLGGVRLQHVPQVEELRVELLDQARSLYAELAARGGGAKARLQRARVAVSLAALASAMGRLEVAEQACADALADLEQVEAAEEGRADLAVLRSRAADIRGTLRLRGGDSERSAALHRLAADALRALPDPPEDDLGRTLSNLAVALAAAGRTDEARRVYEEAAGHLRAAAASHPGDAQVRRQLATTLNNLGALLLRDAEPAAAEAQLAEALQMQEELVEARPEDHESAADLARTCLNLSLLLDGPARADEEREILERGTAAARRAVAAFPSISAHRSLLGSLIVNGALFRWSLGEREEALVELVEATDLLEELVREHPDQVDLRHRLGAALANRGGLLAELGRHEQGQEMVERSLAHHRAAVAAEPGSRPFAFHLAAGLLNLATILLERGESARALEALEEAVPLVPFDPSALVYAAEQCAIGVARAEGAAPEAPGEGEAFADLAVRALEAARAAGWNDAADLRGAARWDVLRDRAEFAALLGGAPPR